MDYELDKQLDDLSKLIRSAIETSPEIVRELLEAQKALLETMLIANHLNANRVHKCDGENCAGHKNED